MTFEEFRQRYGFAFYEFLNSELGQAWITVMEKNDPATRATQNDYETQSKNSTLFLGQITGWRDAVLATQTQCIAIPGPKIGDILATYADEGDLPETGAGEGIAPPPPPPTPIRKRSTPKTQKRKRK